MQVEIFTLCDAATISDGKLNILGTFDTIGAVTFPCRHPLCALASKLRFEIGEEGDHSFELHFCDPDMRPVLEPFVQNINMQIPNERSQCHAYIWNLFNFQLDGPGEYYFELKVDGETKSRVPLYVMQVHQRQ